ncbi:hypothetical protein MiTe_02758 [Microcystis aeruginosa NIES-2520]|uniref:Uncharacterized protein n=1 Tax=Microcystis aeruginosa NIES-2520 TaxID=2303982 RepID=A0A5A5RS15_MICAE|nr:hypothetical protein MiTe_02758 [Microcystis aeruginosa NIES-2520]
MLVSALYHFSLFVADILLLSCPPMSGLTGVGLLQRGEQSHTQDEKIKLVGHQVCIEG